MQVVGVGEKRGRKKGFSRKAVRIPSFPDLSGQSELPPNIRLPISAFDPQCRALTSRERQRWRDRKSLAESFICFFSLPWLQKQILGGDPNQEAKLGHQPHCAVDDSLVKTVSVPSLEVASARSDHVCWIGDWNEFDDKSVCRKTYVLFNPCPFRVRRHAALDGASYWLVHDEARSGVHVQACLRYLIEET